jgi:hypothetical protein
MPNQSKPKSSKKGAAKSPAHPAPDVDVEEIRSQIVESILNQVVSQRRLPTLRASGYTQSEGKNYGSYNRE